MFFFTFSCSTPPAIAGRPYGTIKLEELSLQAESDPARAIETAHAFLVQKDKNTDAAMSLPEMPLEEELASIITRSSERLAKIYEEGISTKNGRLALGALKSLRAVASIDRLEAFLSPFAKQIAFLSSNRESELIEISAEEFFAKGLITPALLVYIDALDALSGNADESAQGETHKRATDLSRSVEKIIPNAQGWPATLSKLPEWASRAARARNRPILRRLVVEMEQRKIPIASDIAEFIASRETMAEMSKGVVTVRIDKGIKIEQGIGTPDRVLGTGFFIDANGYILTNYHVIQSEVDPEYEGFSRLTIRPAGAPELRIPAKVVGWDPILDIALIKADSQSDYIFGIGQAVAPASGTKVFAIGSPAGLENTITSGIVSASGRRLFESGEAMQVDAALNPGNSGGPLLDESGELLGIVFAGLPAFQGLSFGVPASWVAKILPDLFRGGELKRSWLGLAVAETDSRLEITYRHRMASQNANLGESVLSINGFFPKKVVDVQSYLLSQGIGELAIIELGSSSGSRFILSKLIERPPKPLQKAALIERRELLFPALLGMTVRSIPGSLLVGETYTIEKIYPGSIADESGLSVNDPIAIQRFSVDKEVGAVIIQIYVKKRKSGFLESFIQIPASLEIPDFI